MSGTARLRWGILGTGGIAHRLAEAVGHSRTGALVAVGSRARDTAEAFGQKYGATRCHPTYEDLLADPEVDVVYNALPNHLHAEWTIKAAAAGKHILCEKPLALHRGQAMAMVEAARYHRVFLMEAFMYRCHPQTARLVELVRDGAIGQLRLIEASFSFDMGVNLANIRQQNSAGGGGIMDVGCYTLSMARLLAGAATGGEAADPLEVRGCAHLGEESRVDEWAVAAVRFPGEVLANLSCGTRCAVDSGVRLWGSEGRLTVPQPWFPGQGESQLLLARRGKEPETIVVRCELPLYAHEVDTVTAHLAAGQAPSPCMTWADSLGQQHSLDRWRESVGLVFDAERDETALSRTVSGRPLARRRDAPMRYGQVAGIGQPVARLVMGTMIYRPAQQGFANALLDYYVELGGNAFDTAHVYGGGQCEQALGHWIRLRGVRDQVVVIAKGGVVSTVTPQMIETELAISLDRLQTDYADLYLMHRDNPQVPVGEFVDLLNRWQRAGRVRAFGGSNWTCARLEEANAFAARHGLTGFAASSPNLSLAAWNEPVWADCVTASDPASRGWYEKHRLPLFAWSSQAQGFFTGRYRPDGTADADMARCWYNPGNWQRLERARALAADRGVDPTQIAVAYVLGQPFPTFALVGPRSFEELRTTALGLEVELTAGERAWLNLERDRR